MLLSGSMEVIIPSSRAFVPRWLLIAFYGAMTVLAGIANTVTFFEMGQKMGPYPMFLLYFTTMIYVTLYGLTGALTVRARMWKGEVSGTFYSNFVLPEQQRRLVALGFWLIVNGLFSQFANPYVDGNLQSVLYQVCARVPACRHGCARVCGYAWVRLVLARPRALFALAAASSCCSFFLFLGLCEYSACCCRTGGSYSFLFANPPRWWPSMRRHRGVAGFGRHWWAL